MGSASRASSAARSVLNAAQLTSISASGAMAGAGVECKRVDDAADVSTSVATLSMICLEPMLAARPCGSAFGPPDGIQNCSRRFVMTTRQYVGHRDGGGEAHEGPSNEIVPPLCCAPCPKRCC